MTFHDSPTAIETPKQCVAEVQGLFGTVSISEIVFQKIWQRGDFRTDALKTLSGKSLKIISRGKWNRLGGPDFLGAELEIDGQRVSGDVEFHFYAEDWAAHGHAENPAFGNVVLHVLLFPPKKSPPTKNARGNAMETFLLLPHLNCDIEEYASADALAAIEGRREHEEALTLLLAMPLRERADFLRENARERYSQKVRFMKKRLEKTPWEQTLHEVVLETLGLRRNRTTMAQLALKFSPSAMLLAGAETLFKAGSGAWSLSGVRPANHPRARLAQYLKLLEKNPSWTRRLRDEIAELPTAKATGDGFPISGKIFRAEQHLPSLHNFFAEEIFAGTIGGTRFETLMCDAILPLAAAERGVDFFPLWFFWFIGDAPAKAAKILRAADIVSREQPLCCGAFQGLLQVFLTRGI